jgi:hypothetical protein
MKTIPTLGIGVLAATFAACGGPDTTEPPTAPIVVASSSPSPSASISAAILRPIYLCPLGITAPPLVPVGQGEFLLPLGCDAAFEITSCGSLLDYCGLGLIDRGNSVREVSRTDDGHYLRISSVDVGTFLVRMAVAKEGKVSDLRVSGKVYRP